MITIDPEFKALIPPLLPEERKGLEESILKEGCRDALVVWKGHNILVDGHNRYEICTAHGKPFETIEMEFASRDDAMVWIIDNQISRRNLTPFARGELALKRKHIIAAKAKENQGFRTDICQNSDKSKPINTRAELAKIAGFLRKSGVDPPHLHARGGDRLLCQNSDKACVPTPTHARRHFWRILQKSTLVPRTYTRAVYCCLSEI